MSCFKPVTTGKSACGEQSQHPAGGREGHGVQVCSSSLLRLQRAPCYVAAVRWERLFMSSGEEAWEQGRGSRRQLSKAFHGSYVSWLAPWCAGNSWSNITGCFTPKTPNFWAEALHTTPAGDSSLQDRCHRDTNGNSKHHRKALSETGSAQHTRS